MVGRGDRLRKVIVLGNTTDAVKIFRPPAARHCTFVFGPPKTQTQPPKPPRPSLQVLFRGLCLRFRVHNHNERSHDKRSQRRKVTTCFVDPPRHKFSPAISPTPTRLQKPSETSRIEPAASPSTRGGSATGPPAIALRFSGVAFAFSPHPTRHFRGVR